MAVTEPTVPPPPRQPAYRLYVDEVGNPDMGASEHPTHRFLSLTGVIMSLEHVQAVVHPTLESIKQRIFGSHPDDPIFLHRKELVNKQPPFDALRDADVESQFNDELIALLRTADYAAITVVFDKLAHRERYERWRHDPYHYCLTELVERYVVWLRERDVSGDVMAEARGGAEDRRLKEEFTRVYDQGSAYVAPDEFVARLTSRQIKLRRKEHNVAGLQLADVLAHPALRGAQARRAGGSLPATFGGRLIAILENGKYVCDERGEIEGWGRRWLP